MIPPPESKEPVRQQPENSPFISPSAEALEPIQQLYNAGLCLQAYEASRAIGPLHRWQGSTARTLAGRLASNLGAYRLGSVTHWIAWREDRKNPDLAAYHGRTVLHRRGPLAALDFLEHASTLDPAERSDGMMHLLTVRASVAVTLRDFLEAHTFLDQAAVCAPDHPWVATTRAEVFEAEDRYPEALDSAREALRLRPWYRPGIQGVAHALRLLDRDEEARDFLKEADARLENMHVARQLQAVLLELGDYEAAAAALNRFESLAPLLEENEQKWVTCHRVALASLRGDRATALIHAKTLDDPIYKQFVERLESGNYHRQVRLNVPFVRQHHMTCAPATLTAICRYWNQPAEHLEIAEAICYDGTPGHSERHWAESNGFVTREFTVTEAAATTLLDRGIPFTLATVETTSAHLQAVIGYDELRQTFWVRDPFVYTTQEFFSATLLERYRSTGPRGLALVPSAKASLFDGLELPDAAAFDELYKLQQALEKHQRADAQAICQSMQTAMPEHRLTYRARQALANYDRNTPALLECLEGLLRQFPNEGHLLLGKLSCLRELARREERLKLLKEISQKPGMDPIFWLQYAHELRADARQHRAATSWVKWAMRYRASDPSVISALADLLWDQREFKAAGKLYRFAACIAEKAEGFSRSHFIASLHLRESDKALEFLRQRQARLRKNSASPTITLIESLLQVRRTSEAFEVLESVLKERPHDGGLALFAADFYGRHSNFKKAAEHLASAQSRSQPVIWHQTAAALAAYQNEKSTALEHWRQVRALEPLSYDAARSLAPLIAETEGRDAAWQFLESLCERFPFSCPLLTLQIQWLNEAGPQVSVPKLKRLLEVNPADAWAWRELALQYSAQGNKADALAAVQEAIRIEPNQSSGYAIRGPLLAQEGSLAEGRADLLRAVRLEVDNEYAVQRYVESAQSLAERLSALKEIAAELRRQVIFSNALFSYRNAARGVLPPAEVLELLREAHQSRPELWQAWSVLIQQLADLGNHDEASAVAREMTERFPLLPRAWIDLAYVRRATLDVPGEIASLEKALELSPSYSYAARLLAGLYEREHNLARARAILETACAADPLDAFNHGCLAEIFWKLEEKPAAIGKLQRALQLNPDYEWAWDALANYSSKLEQPSLAPNLARELTRTRGGEARSWLLLADRLDPHKDEAELFGALDRALVLSPQNEKALDARARYLALLHRFDEALATCSPPGMNPAPMRLKIRAAWVEAHRGNLSKAIELAKIALAEHPDYYGGWSLLAEWYVSINELAEASEAVKHMAALAPQDAVPLGYLGDLKLRMREIDEAKAAFQRAFALDHDYAYAGFELFEIHLSAGEFDSAKQVLAILNQRNNGYRVQECNIRLAVAKKRLEEALRQFEDFCLLPDHHIASFARAARALDRAGLQKKVDGILAKLLDSAETTPLLAAFWVERRTKSNCWKLHETLAKLHAKSPTGRTAILHYLDQLGDAFGEAKEFPRRWFLKYHLHKLLDSHRKWLFEDVEGWGKVGYVLTKTNNPKSVIAWLSDWKNRPKAESWMLYNLILMMHRAGRYDESLEIIRHGVELKHSEDLYESFRIWAAFEEALLGRAEVAEAHLSALPREKVKQHLLPNEAMTRVLIQTVRQTPEQRHASLPQIREQIKKSFGDQHPCRHSGYPRISYRRFLRVMAPQVNGIRWWGWWYYIDMTWISVPVSISCFLTVILGPAYAFVGLCVMAAAFLYKVRENK